MASIFQNRLISPGIKLNILIANCAFHLLLEEWYIFCYICKQLLFLSFSGIYLTTVFIKIVLIIVCTVMVVHIYHKHENQEMSTAGKVITLLLVKITCVERSCSNTGTDDEFPRETVPHEPRKGELHEPLEVKTCQEKVPDIAVEQTERRGSSPPYPHLRDIGRQPNGRLTPLPFNKVAPLNGRLKSSNSLRSLRTVRSASYRSQLELSPIPTWIQLSVALERLFYVIFLLASFLIHLIMLLMLSNV